MLKTYKLTIYAYFGETTIKVDLTDNEAALLTDIHDSIVAQNGQNNLLIELAE